MHIGVYRFAEHNIEIRSLYNEVHKLCRDYKTDCTADFCVETTEEDIEYENLRSNESRAQKGWKPRTYTDDYLETLAVYRKICARLLPENILLFHCSALALDGRAYIFTAPSGTGKSTHARLWREHFGERVTMINDDKPLLKFEDDGIYVYGTPYAGKEDMQTNTSAKVEGVVVLHQAAENSIEPMTVKDAFPALLRQSYRDDSPEGTLKVLELVNRLIKLPVYSLGCTISDEAVALAYEALTGNE